eukprot:TRINITY_DN26869_c0_g2_i1.p3 TRINITY_DN26869_c0_g2~~TRINITY_DN26869_c0_g2_i1.p3  ORF type:complete len:117 (+),score=30.19 TRINITY_DN26869_c0_g2_i1:46-351(+)
MFGVYDIQLMDGLGVVVRIACVVMEEEALQISWWKGTEQDVIMTAKLSIRQFAGEGWEILQNAYDFVHEMHKCNKLIQKEEDVVENLESVTIDIHSQQSPS